MLICGKHTVDGETAQVGPEVAELLGIPHVSGAGKIDQVEVVLLDDAVRVQDQKREKSALSSRGNRSADTIVTNDPDPAQDPK